MLRLEFNKLAWWYWLVADVLLMLALWVERDCFVVALAFNLFQLLHFILRQRSFTAFPVQVRAGYWLWLLAGLAPGLFWMHWIQLAGTSAMLLFGYCPLARMLSLLPWNRRQPFTLQFMVRTFLVPPTSGSIRDNPHLVTPPT
ncbi:MAG: hypothetical protein ACOY7J_13010 [Pseudomonadota bacterium]